MINNPCVNRIAALVMMFMIYAAGYASGKDQAVLAFQETRPCKITIKP